MPTQINADISLYLKTEDDILDNGNDGSSSLLATRIAQLVECHALPTAVTANIGAIAGAVSGTKMQVDVVTLPSAITSNLSTISGAVSGTEMQVDVVTLPGSIATNVATVAGAVAGSEMQVDVVTLPSAVTTNISTLSGAVSGSEVQVDIVTLPGTLAADVSAIASTISGSEIQADIVTLPSAVTTNISTLAGAVSGTEVQVDIVTIPSITIGAAIPTGTNNIGRVAGNTLGFPGVSATYTRPADTTAYTAGDALSNSTSAPSALTFSNCARVSGGSGFIVGARLELSNTSFNGKIALYLYRVSPTPTNDNAALTLTASADFIGWIEFDSANIKGLGTTVAYIEGDLPGDRILPFTATGLDLFGQTGVLTGFTPTSGGTFKFSLAVEQN